MKFSADTRQTRLFSPFQSPPLSVSVFVHHFIPLHLPCVICTVTWCLEGCVRWGKIKIIHNSPQKHQTTVRRLFWKCEEETVQMFVFGCREQKSKYSSKVQIPEKSTSVFVLHYFPTLQEIVNRRGVEPFVSSAPAEHGLHILDPFTLPAPDKTGNWGAFGQQASLWPLNRSPPGLWS